MRISDWSSDVCSSDLSTGGWLSASRFKRCAYSMNSGLITLSVASSRKSEVLGAVESAAITFPTHNRQQQSTGFFMVYLRIEVTRVACVCVADARATLC